MQQQWDQSRSSPCVTRSGKNTYEPTLRTASLGTESELQQWPHGHEPGAAAVKAGMQPQLPGGEVLPQ
jgi:hypothetical protein